MLSKGYNDIFLEVILGKCLSERKNKFLCKDLLKLKSKILFNFSIIYCFLKENGHFQNAHRGKWLCSVGIYHPLNNFIKSLSVESHNSSKHFNINQML